ncbi:MAG: TonB-dependent receptor domain-containing protein [Maricaulaceae bacterium]
MTFNERRGRWFATTILATFAAGTAQMAAAQEVEQTPEPVDTAQQDLAQVEQIVVTGSRLARPGLESASPVTVVDSAEVNLTGTVNIEILLNTLPQTVSGLTNTSNNPGNGTATIDLRGLGAPRTLVLVDGIRFVPSGAGGVTDINSVPASLVERVDVVTGGAGAIYGSDALAGVVNFVLRDDFEGVELDGQYSLTGQGDGEVLDLSVTLGGNFAGGRGNAVLSASYTDRNPVFQGDREFSFFELADATVDASQAFAVFDGIPAVPAGATLPAEEGGVPGFETGGSSGNLGSTLFTGIDFGDGAGPVLSTFDPDGTIRPFTTADLFNFAPFNFLQIPQERFNITGIASYEVNQYIEFFSRGVFTQNRVDQELAPTPVFLGLAGNPQAVVNVDNPFLTPEAQDLFATQLDEDGDGLVELTLGRRLAESTSRQSLNEFDVFQIVVGGRGNLPGEFLEERGWRWDLSIAHAESTANTVLFGDASLDNFLQGLLVTTDDAGNPVCIDPSGGCAPINIFGAGNISPEAVDFIDLSANEIIQTETTVITLTSSGDVVEIPWTGESAALSIGVEYREELSASFPDDNLATGNVLGFNDSPPVAGSFNVIEFFFEGRVPIVRDLPFAQTIDLQFGYRFSDFSTIGSVNTFFGGGDWQVYDDLRLRGLFQRAVRAPNIAELFSPQVINFPGAADPCAADGAGGAFDPTVPGLTEFCIAAGVPADAVNTPLIQLPAAQVTAFGGGNPDLDAETSRTITAGAIFQPSFAPGLSVTADYFNIIVEDVIAAFGGTAQNVINQCFLVFQDLSNEFCEVINRGPSGLISEVFLVSQNAAFLSTEGIDLQVNYGFDVRDIGLPDAGSVDLSFIGTYLLEDDFQADSVSPVNECAGIFGDVCGEPNARVRFTSRATWNYGPLSLSTRYRWISGTSSDAFGGVRDELDAEGFLDITGFYDVTENFRVRAGVLNITGNDPPIIGENEEQANTFPATFEVLGRQIFFGGTVNF